MDKAEYLKLTKAKIKNKNSKQLLINQINNFYDIVDNCKPRKHKYKKWDLGQFLFTCELNIVAEKCKSLVIEKENMFIFRILSSRIYDI